MASTYLTHTTSTPTNNDICTISFWTKFSNVSSDLGVFSQHTDSNNRIQLARLASGSLSLFQKVSSTIEISITTNRVFRDCNAWYHVVIAFDTTQSTASNRVKFYVNGVQETSFSVSTYPSQNTDIRFNSSSLSQEIGRITADTYMDGYINHVAFVDGTALTPSNFGETDTASGIWKWKSPSGVTYGNNGFHLKFDNSANLGLDSSGETNNFTLSGNGRQAKDNPTLSNTTYNSLAQKYTSGTSYSNGNLTTTNTSNVGQRMAISTFGVETGKWYAEFKLVAIGSTGGSKPYVGVCSQRDYVGNTYVGGPPGCGLHTGGDIYYAGNGPTSTGTSYTTGNIIGVALDVTNSLIYWHKDGNLYK